MDVTWARNFFRLRVKAERVLPIPPMTINRLPIIRIDHWRTGEVFWLETAPITDDVVAVKIDIDDEDMFDDDAIG